MLSTRLIPCLDVDHGRVVKGVRFAALRDCGEPATLAERYEAQGADEIVLLDISATLQGRAHQLDTVRSVRQKLGIPLCVGGGVRSVADARMLLEAGADKIAVNSAAIADPALLSRLAAEFGSQAVVLAIDAQRSELGHTVRSHAGSTATRLQPASWAAEGAKHGAGEVLLTSIDRDGTGNGYDLELLTAVRAAIELPLIASGGARTVAHLAAGIRAGADAILLASALHDGEVTVRQLKQNLQTLALPIRP